MIYILCFILSLLFLHIGLKEYKDPLYAYNNNGVCYRILRFKQSRKFYVALFLSILIPSLLAGLRDTSIGTDVEYYILSDFATAKRYDGLFNFFSKVPGREKLYLTIVYIVAKLTPGTYQTDVHFLLFILELLTTSLIVYGAFKLKNDASVTMIMIVYYLMHYNGTYNIMRQYLAEAIIFASLHLLLEKKYKHYFICILISSLFHTASVIMLVLIPVYIGLNSRKNNRLELRGLELTLIFGSCLFTLCIKYIAQILVNIGFLAEKYMYYFNTESISSNNVETVFYLIELLFLFCVSEKKVSKKKEFDLLRLNLFFCFILLQLTRIIYYGNRISMYFSIINILALAKIPDLFNARSGRKMIRFLLISILTFYWYYIYIKSNSGETYPYQFYFK